MKQINQIFASTLALAFAFGMVLAPVVSIAATLVPSITAPANGSTVTVGQSITFSGNATGGTAPYAYVWDFGDTTGGAGQNFTKSYSAAGARTVKLTVTDFMGVAAETTINLTVGSGTSDPLTITNIRVTDVTQNSAIIRWTTNRVADSRVIYDTVSHANISGQSAPNYGYANSTATSDTTTKVTEHAVTVTGLSANTQYFFRVISQE